MDAGFHGHWWGEPLGPELGIEGRSPPPCGPLGGGKVRKAPSQVIRGLGEQPLPVNAPFLPVASGGLKRIDLDCHRAGKWWQGYDGELGSGDP